MVPDETAGGKADSITKILEAPCNVNIISRLPKLRVKSSELQQNAAPKGHVTARHVLRLALVQEYMCCVSRRGGNCVLDESGFRRREIRSSHSGISTLLQRMDKMGEPVGIDEEIGISKCHDIACSFMDPNIACYR